jgi:hypothetical protein
MLANTLTLDDEDAVQAELRQLQLEAVNNIRLLNAGKITSGFSWAAQMPKSTYGCLQHQLRSRLAGLPSKAWLVYFFVSYTL